MTRNREISGDCLITLISDFGDRFAQAQVELAAHSVNPRAKFVVVSNEVTPFSILEGAFLLAKSYKFSPKDSIHVGVVDPGVGSERKGLLIRTQDYWFVGPDNGLLYPAAKDNGIEEVFIIDEQKLNKTGLNTFHGRDVFAPAAARLSLGESPLNFAEPVDSTSIHEYNLEPDQVAHIDRYGNVKLTSSSEQFKDGDQVSIDLITGRIVIPYCKTFADVPKGSLLAYQGSHGTLELARNLGSAAQSLKLSVGQRLEINRYDGQVDRVGIPIDLSQGVVSDDDERRQIFLQRVQERKEEWESLNHRCNELGRNWYEARIWEKVISIKAVRADARRLLPELLEWEALDPTHELLGSISKGIGFTNFDFSLVEAFARLNRFIPDSNASEVDFRLSPHSLIYAIGLCDSLSSSERETSQLLKSLFANIEPTAIVIDIKGLLPLVSNWLQAKYKTK